MYPHKILGIVCFLVMPVWARPVLESGVGQNPDITDTQFAREVVVKDVQISNQDDAMADLQKRDINYGWYDKEEELQLQAMSERNVYDDDLKIVMWSVTTMLSKLNIRWAIAGGLGQKLNGQTDRRTSDLDIIVETPLANIRAILKSHPKRYIAPDLRTWPGGPHIRYYYSYSRTRDPHYIELDFIESGSVHMPQDVYLNSNPMTVKIDTIKEANHYQIRVMKPSILFIGKSYALLADWRHKDEKDMKDLRWFIDNKPGCLKGIQNKLPFEIRWQVFSKMKAHYKDPKLDSKMLTLLFPDHKPPV